MSPSYISRHRTKVIKDVLELRESLLSDEAKLHGSMSPHISKVKGKHILLFRRLLEDNGYDDMEVISFLSRGVDLTGAHSLPAYAESKVVPATSTREQLRRESTWRRKSLASQHLSEDDFNKLEEQTLKEVELGFLDGPMDDVGISNALGTPNWLLNPRFLLLQGPSPLPSRAWSDSTYRTSILLWRYANCSGLADTAIKFHWIFKRVRRFREQFTPPQSMMLGWRESDCWVS